MEFRLGHRVLREPHVRRQPYFLQLVMAKVTQVRRGHRALKRPANVLYSAHGRPLILVSWQLLNAIVWLGFGALGSWCCSLFRSAHRQWPKRVSSCEANNVRRATPQLMIRLCHLADLLPPSTRRRGLHRDTSFSSRRRRRCATQLPLWGDTSVRLLGNGRGRSMEWRPISPSMTYVVCSSIRPW